MDIKPEHLRINNWVNYESKPYQIEAISETYPFIRSEVLMGVGVVHYGNIEGIHLTEDILIKAGFEIDNNFGNWHLKDYVIYTKKINNYLCNLGVKNDKVYWYFASDDDYYSWVQELPFVHKLQNLCYEIMNQELTINL
jgi:hypothetical protein